VTKLLGWIVRRLTVWTTVSSMLVLTSVVFILATRTGIDWGDAPAWVAFGVSMLSTFAAMHSARSSRTAAKAAETSAQAGVRQAAAAEEQLVLSRRALELAEQQALTGNPLRTDLLQEALTPQQAPYVAWWIEQRSRNTYALRNIGTDTAYDVEIDQSRIQCVVRGATKADEIAPDASVEIILMPMMGAPKPNELWIRWRDHPEWQAVRVP
jgi:hypothetical protein